ncbi:hypothetical protein A6R68_15751 [Neotoma lepida]|uniref:RRM domain-containing protein n=1 Tax=Neotoma lepida TaxID=56216 RepID=A0A1A6H5W9_NEOLE|nr:hypothetical protein A6R68_03647 [Neotoma lepida]OBS73711.1 hypothetical protein A6R68_15751 [Neotoma lepida]
MDAEGKSRGCCTIVELKMEGSMIKAAEALNKHTLNGRPQQVKEDPDCEHVSRAMKKAGRLASTVFIVDLDYKVGWTKTKEIFSVAGAVVQANILEGKDEKNHGLGTNTHSNLPRTCWYWHGGQHINDNHLNKSIGMGNLGPSGLGREDGLWHCFIGGIGKEHMGAGLGMDRVGSEIEYMGLVMDHVGSVEAMDFDIGCMGSIIDYIGQTMELTGSGI